MKLNFTSLFFIAALPLAFAEDVYLITNSEQSMGGSRMPAGAGCIEYASIKISRIFKCKGWTMDVCVEAAIKTGEAATPGSYTNGYSTRLTPNGMDIMRNGRVIWANKHEYTLKKETWPALPPSCGLGYKIEEVKYSVRAGHEYLG
jgi:hypothetical protein